MPATDEPAVTGTENYIVTGIIGFLLICVLYTIGSVIWFLAQHIRWV